MLPESLLRLLSHIRPVDVERQMGLHGPLVVRWEDGRKVLNTSRANQSFGSLHRVWQHVLEALWAGGTRPQSVLMLGYGGGSAAWVLRNELGCEAPITGVEHDPRMIALAREHFGADDLADLRLVRSDALDFLQNGTQRHDLVLVDLFDDLDPAPVMARSELPSLLRARTTEGGVICINTVIHDAATAALSGRIASAMRQCCGDVEEIRVEDANRVYIARCTVT